MAVLKADNRSEMGSRNAVRLREQGMIPAVVYGHGEGTEAISLNGRDLNKALNHGERILEIEVDGKKQNVLVKEAQYDALGMDLLHVDLARVNLDERVEVSVPIVLRGTPAGAAEGGVLNQTHSEVLIEVSVRNIPDELRISVADMQINDHLTASKLQLPDGAELVDDPETVIATVSMIAEEEEAPAEEEAPEAPEVIGEKPEEEEESGEEK